jgi:hypothetical protein
LSHHITRSVSDGHTHTHTQPRMPRTSTKATLEKVIGGV